MNDSWPFADTPNAAAITQRTILEGGRPILLVVHDEGGEGWQFLDGGEFRAEEALIVALKTIVLFDASISARAAARNPGVRGAGEHWRAGEPNGNAHVESSHRLTRPPPLSLRSLQESSRRARTSRSSSSALADLPPGWQAFRTGSGEPWRRERSV
jgi:hypothetical protein